MNTIKIIEILSYTLPSLISGGIAYYFFDLHIKNEEGRRRFLLHKEAQKNALPLRLQAYERMTLFLERITPAKLLLRITPLNANKYDYEELLIKNIEQEFEHNMTQQIYISNQCWAIINTAKNATIQMIRKITKEENITNSDQLRETILSSLLSKESPSGTALIYIKKEVSELW